MSNEESTASTTSNAKSKPDQFVHLHTHSHYSLLDGLSQIDPLVKKAAAKKMPALALTDHGNLHAAVEFYKKCQAAEIKPIIGVEAYIAARKHTDKEPNVDSKRFHLTLLSKNNKGYSNLIKLVSKAALDGYYYKPRMDHDMLREHSEGLICLSGCFGGEFMKALRRGDEKGAREVAKMYQEIFGKDNYYIEIMSHPGIEGLMEARAKAIEIARELDIPLVATADSHYPESADKRAHEALLAIQTDTSMSDGNRLSMADDDFHFTSTREMIELFKDVPDAITNTVKIAEECNVEMELDKWIFPNYVPKDGMTHDEELRELTEEGIKFRKIEVTPETRKRIDYELKVIADRGFAPFYLVTADIMRKSRELGIHYTVRGSGAGSITAYLTRITNVDPIEYQLPFERFLNPFRPTPPDFDMDFADDRRDELIDYVREKYGEENVAQIGTFGKMMAKAAVRDVARALGKPYSVGNTIANLIPVGAQGFPMFLDKALKIEPDLRKMYKEDAEAKEIIDLAKKLEGNVRHVGVHAAGVVIAPGPLTDYVPIALDPRGGKKITQFDMYSLDPNSSNGVVGLLKFDFLGIRNLAILDGARKRVEVIHGKKIELEDIPIDDTKTFEMLARGETMGLFQLGGAAMTRFLVDLKPSSIHDINAMVALYRPGPMNNIPEYIERKHGHKKITYYHPKMEKFLAKSYGILVYQDDLLYTAIEVAGYTWENVDKFRKAVGKKIPAEMAKQHIIFVDGCMKTSGLTKKQAEGLWDLFEPFQGYGFNKAHAACYGRVAYQTAYMKANYPAEYMTALLTAESGDLEEVSKIIEECKRMNFVILPPDVNESYSDFTIVQEDGKLTNKIRFGLRSIKNFGEEIGKAIIHERKANGPYKTFSGFLSRIKHKNLNKKSLEALIMCGALDSLGEERGKLLAGLEDALNFHREINKEGNADQASLFGSSDSAPTAHFVLADAEEASLGDKLRWEKELLGLYISGHPLEQYKERFLKHDQTIEKVKELPDGSPVLIAGLMSEAKSLLTKKGDKMMFGRLEDFSGNIELVIFPGAYRDNSELLVADNCLAIRGTVSHRNGNPSVVVERCKSLAEGQKKEKPESE